MNGTDNSTLYIVVAIVALHFVIGIGYLVYKIANSKPRKPDNKQ